MSILTRLARSLLGVSLTLCCCGCMFLLSVLPGEKFEAQLVLTPAPGQTAGGFLRLAVAGRDVAGMSGTVTGLEPGTRYRIHVFPSEACGADRSLGQELPTVAMPARIVEVAPPYRGRLPLMTADAKGGLVIDIQYAEGGWDPYSRGTDYALVRDGDSEWIACGRPTYVKTRDAWLNMRT